MSEKKQKEKEYIYYCDKCKDWISESSLFCSQDDTEWYCGVCETEEKYNVVWMPASSQLFQRKERTANHKKGENELDYQRLKAHFKQQINKCKGDWIQVCSCYSFHQACDCSRFLIFARDPYFGEHATDFRN